MTRLSSRGGFALLSVLWALVAAALLALAATLAGRDAFNSTRNRTNATRAFWQARACADRARATIDAQLQTGDDLEAAATWRALDKILLALPHGEVASCPLHLQAAGALLDINSATDEQLRALFHAIGRSDADALVDALADWRDADDIARPAGAESAWYAAVRELRPRNAALADIRELQFVRGFENLAAFDSFIGTEQAPIALNSAPLTVLASLPGFGPEILQRVAELRAAGDQILDVLALTKGVSPHAASDLREHYAEITHLATVDPVAWLVTARGADGDPASTATIELRITRAGRQAIVVRRRSW
jgi:type II secretory pathway component PulK